MNPEKYLGGVVNLRSVQLVIVGKDPYPNGATRIPFHKSEGQFNYNCSGGVVLRAIGCDAVRSIQTCGNTLNLFLALRDVGIVFLNAIYRTQNVGRKIRKSHDFNALMDAYLKYNEAVLNKAQRVIYCGEAEKIRWINNGVLPHAYEGQAYKVLHPDLRNRRREEYEKWWSPGELQRKFGLELPKGVMTRT